MRWLKSLFGSAREPADGQARAGGQRWVVLDVETSGLDRSNDKLLSIGAVAVSDRRIVVADSFEVVVRQDRASSRGNILVHEIGEEAQLQGVDPRQACREFLDYAGPSPMVGFHSGFDRAFLARAVKAYLGLPISSDWLDLAALAPALNPDVPAKGLDEWLDHFELTVGQRHHASADAFATALLFLRLLAQVQPRHRSFDHLRKLSLSRRWTGS
jgi:DNA polymerase III subunit epsilon